MNWDNAAVAALERMAGDRMSAGQIAAWFSAQMRSHVSRNAIIGKCARMGIQLCSGRNGPRRAQSPKPKSQIPKPLAAPAPAPAPAPSPPIAPVPENARPLLALRAGQCRFAVGADEDGAHLFCASATPDGKSFCFWHAAIAYNREKKK